MGKAMAVEFLGGAALSWLVGEALGRACALVGNAIDERAAGEAIERAVRSAIGRMVAVAPGLREDLLSDSFVQDVLGLAVDRFMDPTQPVDPEALLDTFEERFVAAWRRDDSHDPWTRVFGTPREQALEAMHGFFIELENAFGRDPELQPIAQRRWQREARDEARVARRVAENIESLLAREADSGREPRPLTEEELQTASADLLHWEKQTGGLWMDRGEQQRIVDSIRAGNHQKTVLLGQPGSGKSALLSAIARGLAEDGLGVFAIKADMLPASIRTPGDLSAALLNGRQDLIAAIRATATNRSMVVIIDQLDAVSEMVDGNSDRMFALTRLIHSLTDCDGVRLVVSARPFEYQNDARFRTALPEDKTTEIRLGPPDWSEVEKVVSTVTDPSQLSQATRETLRNPRALVDALPLLENNDFDDTLDGLTAIQSRRLDRLIAGYPAIQLDLVLGRLARQVLEGGDLALVPRPDERRAVDLAVESGVLLREHGGRVRFAHQSWVDTLTCREVLREPGQLLGFVHRLQGNLVTRPRIAAVLRARLGQDPARFSDELQELWDAPETRTHVRHLLIDLSGTADAPQAGETHVIRQAILGNSRAMRQRALTAIANRFDWFDRVWPEVQNVMRRPHEEAWCAWPFLASQAQAHQERVLASVRAIWGARPDMDRACLFLLEKLPTFGELAMEIFRTITGRSAHIDEVLHWGVRGRVKLKRHDEAATLLALTCNRLNELARSQAEAARNEATHASAHERSAGAVKENMAEYVRRRRQEQELSAAHQLESLLRSGHGFHDLPKVVSQDPHPYAIALLAWLASVPTQGSSRHGLGKANRRVSRIADQNETEEGATDHVGSDPHPFEFRLVEAAHAALRSLAEQSSEEFLACIEPYRRGDDELIERLLMRGFAAMAPQNPEAAYTYLMEDEGRLSVGPWDAPFAETEFLIRRLAPHLSDDQIAELCEAISALELHDTDGEDDPAHRRQKLRWNESHRIRLLSQIPTERRPDHIHRRILEGIRADPSAGRPVRMRVEVGWVAPPMSPEQMAKATDEQLFGLFEEYHDEHHRELGSGFLRGGSDHAARAFGEYAKTDPDRVMRLLARLDPAKHQRPVGAVLSVLSDLDSVDASTVLATLDEMMAKGFDSTLTRNNLLGALCSLASRLPGLDDRWVDLVLSWIEPWSADSSGDIEDASNDDASTVLGDGGAGHISVLKGNAIHLRTVCSALMRREPPAVERWLDVLEAHLGVADHPSVWTVVRHCVDAFYTTDRERSGRFLHSLMLRRPEFRDTRDGVMLLARGVRLLNDTQFAEVLAGLIASEWQLGRLAAGEVAVVRSMRVPEDAQTQAFIDDALTGALDLSSTLGVANGASLFWHGAGCSDAMTTNAHRILVQLAPTASDGIAKAIGQVIRTHEELPRGAETQELLGLIAQNDEIVAALDEFRLADKLNALLVENRCESEIMGLVDAVIRVGGLDLVDLSKRTGLLAEELLPTVLSLHRRPRFQSRTLATFEALLELSVQDADKILLELA